MAFVGTDNTARFELVFTHNGIVCENVYHLHSNVTNWTTGDLSTSCQQFYNWWHENLKSLVSSNTTLTKIIATALHAQTSPKIEYVTGMPDVGTGASTSLPGNVTVAVKWTTGNRGRSARGRTYHIGLVESQVTENLVDESVYTSLLDAYQALQGYVQVSSKALVVLSLWNNGVKRTSGLVTVITGCSIEPTVDTQRRRLL